MINDLALYHGTFEALPLRVEEVVEELACFPDEWFLWLKDARHDSPGFGGCGDEFQFHGESEHACAPDETVGTVLCYLFRRRTRARSWSCSRWIASSENSLERSGLGVFSAMTAARCAP